MIQDYLCPIFKQCAIECAKKKITSYLSVCIICCRAPPLPITCYHGNCYVDCLEVLREHNVTKGLKFILFTEGKSRIT